MEFSPHKLVVLVVAGCVFHIEAFSDVVLSPTWLNIVWRVALLSHLPFWVCLGQQRPCWVLVAFLWFIYNNERERSGGYRYQRRGWVFVFFFTGEDEVFRDKQGSQPHVYTCHVSSYRDRGTILPVTSVWTIKRFSKLHGRVWFCKSNI